MESHLEDDSYCAKFTGIAQVVKERDDVILFVFDKHSMSEATRAYYFEHELFTISTACILDDDVCAYLDLDQVFIKEGNYPIADTGSSYEVRLIVYPTTDYQLI